MEMNIFQQDSNQENPATAQGAERIGEHWQALKYSEPTDEELPVLAELLVSNASLEPSKTQEVLEKMVYLRHWMQLARSNSGHLLGFVSVEPNGPVPGAAYIRYLLVKPEFRRQGVGSCLLRQARHMALGIVRCTSLILRVDPSDGAAVAFVREAGFTTLGALSSKKSGKLRLLMTCEL